MHLTFAQYDDLPKWEQELYYGFLQGEAKAAKIKAKIAAFHSSNGNTTHKRTNNGAEPPQPSS